MLHTTLIKMPSHSIRSVSTVRTVDDVLSQMDTSIPKDASLQDSRKFIRKIAGTDTPLSIETISKLESLHSLLTPVTANTSALIKLMERYDVCLGGVQATSLFYPICEIISCPWDFFCNVHLFDEVVSGFRTSSGADLIEEVTDASGQYRVAHFRKNINGSKSSCSIRIIGSPKSPFEVILSLKNSYEQTVITHGFALFFWPNLQQRGLYRVFGQNAGLSALPRSKTYYQMTVTPGKKTSLRNPMSCASVYHDISGRTEVLTFENTEKFDEVKYKNHISVSKGLVYAVHNSSTRLLGNVAGMK